MGSLSWFSTYGERHTPFSLPDVRRHAPEIRRSGKLGMLSRLVITDRSLLTGNAHLFLQSIIGVADFTNSGWHARLYQDLHFLRASSLDLSRHDAPAGTATDRGRSKSLKNIRTTSTSSVSCCAARFRNLCFTLWWPQTTRAIIFVW